MSQFGNLPPVSGDDDGGSGGGNRSVRPRNEGDGNNASADDFLFDTVNDEFLYIPTGAPMSSASVDGMIPKEVWEVIEETDPGTGEVITWSLGARAGQPKYKAIPPSGELRKLDNGRTIEGRTWWPGRGPLIAGYTMAGQRLRERKGAKIFNEFIPPPEILPSWAGDVSLFSKMLDGFQNNADREDFLDRLAFCVQRVGEKINGIYVLTGPQRKGKDSLFVPLTTYLRGLSTVIGMDDVLDEKSTEWRKNCLAVINETSSTSTNAIDLYEALKPLAASPPFTIQAQEKYVKKRDIINAVTLFMTTNHPRSLHIEEGDGRVTLVPFDRELDENSAQFFADYHQWIDGGGWKAVIYWLSIRDISKFNPKAIARTTGLKIEVMSGAEAVRQNIIDEIIDGFLDTQQEKLIKAARVEHKKKADGSVFINDDPDAKDDDLPIYRPPVILTRQIKLYAAGDAVSDFSTKQDTADVEKLFNSRAAQLPHKMRERGYEYMAELQLRVGTKREDGKVVGKKAEVKGIYYDAALCVGLNTLDERREALRPHVKRIMDVLSGAISEHDKPAEKGGS